MFEQLIDTRIAHLGLKGGDVREALGISWAGWSTLRRRSNIKFETLQKLALVLALPVEVLVSRDPLKAVAEPVPDWPWLTGFQEWTKLEEEVVPEWTVFSERYRVVVPEEVTGG